MATHPNQAAFAKGLQILLTNWPVLRSAVDQGWGGDESREKEQWLIDTLVGYAGERGRRLEPEDVEDVLVQVLSDEFDTVVEDESPRHLGRLVVRLYKECVTGNHRMLETLRLEATKRPQTYSVIQPAAADNAMAQSEEGSDNDDDDDASGSDGSEYTTDDSDDAMMETDGGEGS
ncbi:rRNA accumulation- protein [Dimargaris verticillata]|uniref:rRNA accumulation- protein n=1 Tax=Dimargaris verticillata TaxID=2761393 RepID=A0A9W8B6W4_9FUNG|nr:rRNA accumulation- protein [Dimargaris verticillata]